MKFAALFFAVFLAACSEARAAVEYEGGAYRDPFRHGKGDTEAALGSRREFEEVRALTLGGIASGPGGAQAFIGGQMVEVGSTVSGALVTAIGKNSVTLTYKGKEIILKEKGTDL
jgi:hypothetical protein